MTAGCLQNLGIELAFRISDWITCAQNRTRASGPIFHSYQGPFDSCCWVLWDLGLAFPTDAEGSRDDEPPFRGYEGLPSAYFRFVAQSEFRHRLGKRQAIERERLDELVNTWLAAKGHSGEIERSRNGFVAAVGDGALMDAFVAAGFAEAMDGRFRWTDAMTPYMTASGFWTGSGRDGREPRVEELKTFLTRLPDGARYALVDLARRPDSYLFILKKISDGLDHEGWLVHFPLYGNSPVSIARDLHKLLAPDPGSPGDR